MQLRSLRLCGCVVGLGVVMTCGGSDSPSGPQPPVASANVIAGTTSNTFNPANVRLIRNGTVTWTFGALVHNVTFSTPGAPANITDTFNTSVSRTFTNAGTFNYTCTIHPGMNGSVSVE